MNLLHHMLVSESVRCSLLWPCKLRGQMLLGAIAPDAHTEVPGLGREMLHPTADIVESVLDIAEPLNMRRERCRAFVVSVIAHLVADELTRPHRYHLPPHAPAGFLPVPDTEAGAPNVLDLEPITRSLIRAKSKCALGPLEPAAIDRKRWEVLGRWPLTEGEGHFLVVEPLAAVVDECAAETLERLYHSEQGAALLGSWRA